MATTVRDERTGVSHGRPLEGRRVLVTRARAQAEGLMGLLRRAGASPVLFPAIAVEPAVDYTALDAALAAPTRYDWIVFTSANAVTYVERRLRVNGRDWSALSRLKVAAVGPKVAAALAERGVATAFMPEEYTGEA